MLIKLLSPQQPMMFQSKMPLFAFPLASQLALSFASWLSISQPNLAHQLEPSVKLAGVKAA
jgi:hypothetical protein